MIPLRQASFRNYQFAFEKGKTLHLPQGICCSGYVLEDDKCLPLAPRATISGHTDSGPSHGGVRPASLWSSWPRRRERVQTARSTRTATSSILRQNVAQCTNRRLTRMPIPAYYRYSQAKRFGSCHKVWSLSPPYTPATTPTANLSIIKYAVPFGLPYPPSNKLIPSSQLRSECARTVFFHFLVEVVDVNGLVGGYIAGVHVCHLYRLSRTAQRHRGDRRSRTAISSMSYVCIDP